ncbi:MAG: SIMPL domain-containing protein [Terriglobales bacterium]
MGRTSVSPGPRYGIMYGMKATITLLIALLASTAAPSQDRPAITAQPNSVFVGADGKFEANPDTAVMQFNISAQEGTSREAYDHASRAAEQVRQILRSNGIDPKSAEIGYASLQPVYDFKTAKRKLVGYQVNENVSLKLKDFTKVAPIVQQLADADVTETQSLNYTLENMDAAKAKAVEDAYRRAHDSAAALARSAGRTLGELSYASVDTFENVRPMPMARSMMKMNVAGAAPAPTEEFTPQSVSVTAHVNALFNLK